MGLVFAVVAFFFFNSICSPLYFDWISLLTFKVVIDMHVITVILLFLFLILLLLYFLFLLFVSSLLFDVFLSVTFVFYSV